jgi:opacity protein-like surface antigen
MKYRVVFAIVVFLSLVPLMAQAQKNELAAEGSGVIVADATDPGFGGGFQLNYARRLIGVPGIGVYGEIPFVAGLNNAQVLVSQRQALDYRSYFITPGVRVKFLPAFPVSPYLAAGVGWSHFSSKQNSATDDEFAADWGAGLDIKLVPFTGSLGKQNSVVVSAGVVLRF